VGQGEGGMRRLRGRRLLVVGAVIASTLVLPGNPFAFPAIPDVEALELPPGPPPGAFTAADREIPLADFEEDGVRNPEQVPPLDIELGLRGD
jgi:hypothetical protein